MDQVVGVGQQSVDELLERIDRANEAVGRAQREMLALIARLEEPERPRGWEGFGARDLAHLLCIRYGISSWKAERMIGAARALEHLPVLSSALERGALSLDKVLELCRIATPETETRLLRWAGGVSCTAIRRRADRELPRGRQEAAQLEHERTLSWCFFDQGRRFALQAQLPAAEGALVAGAIEHLAGRIPALAGEEDPWYEQARRADALVALCTGAGTGGPGSDEVEGSGPICPAEPPTVVIHAPLETLASDDCSCEVTVDGHLRGGLVHVESIRRLACTSRVQVVAEDRHGNAVAMGRTTRVPSAAMLRQLVYRDTECRFPGCGARRFTQAHHIRWWSRGGRTDLDNLVLLCTFHHTLVHEHGWSLVRDADNAVRWYRPDGRAYRAGPAPPAMLAPDDTSRSSHVLDALGAPTTKRRQGEHALVSG